MKYYRIQQNGAAIWKILEHREPKTCPECREKNSLSYLGFVETYMSGLHGKMYQCNGCESWVDLIWQKHLGRFIKKQQDVASV